MLGALPPGQSISVVVGLPIRDPSGLTGRLTAEYIPGNPLSGKFLSSTELAAQYGPSAETVAAAEAYFGSLGLSATVSPDHLLLSVAGPSAAVAKAFGTTFDAYREPSGEMVFSHPTAAVLPADLAVSGVLGLGDVTELHPAAGLARLAPVSGSVSNCSGGSTFAPCDLQGAYNMTPLLANGTTGAGERIAVVDAYSSGEPQPTLSSDLATFASDNNLTLGPTEFVYPDPTSLNLNKSGTNTAWSLEDALDLEWSHATAPGATVEMTFSPDASEGIYAAVDWLVGHQAANVISMSWGEPDVGIFNAYSTPCSYACNASSDGSYGLLDPVLEFAAAEGISLFAASGDCGASDGTSGLATNFPASDPYVTGVGGTVLTVGTGAKWAGEVAWSGNSSGAVQPGCLNQGGSGGGYSPYSRPWWQTGLPSTPELRGVPDVSLDAGSAVGVVLGGSTVLVFGTSIGTPFWAAIAALADQYHGAPLGFLDPGLYFAAAHDYSTDFHDITSGWNGYSAGPGWDPVTGLGSPNLVRLVPDLSVGAPRTTSWPSVFLYASPRFGPSPLLVDFHVVASGGTGHYPLVGVTFGDGNASTSSGNDSFSHYYPRAGVYSAFAYAVDSGANISVSAPIAIVVGGGHQLSLTLSASNTTPSVAAPVTFSLTAAGGTPPYSYTLSFGDETYLLNTSETSVSHVYGAAGSFCAAATVEDSAAPPNGAQSLRLAIGVGGAPKPTCGNDSVPVVVTPVPNVGPRDAPADFPSLFNWSGGASGTGTVAPSLQFTSSDPYLHACGCAILREPGNYTIEGWVNDSLDQGATGNTTVEVTSPLEGFFTASPMSGVAPLKVQLAARVAGGYRANASLTRWNLGEDQVETGASLDITYSSPGEYLVTGQISDQAHGNTSEGFLIDVLPAQGPEPVGVSGAIEPAVNISSGSVVQFTGSPVGPGTSGPNVSLRWSFENGESAWGPSVNQTFLGPLPPASSDTYRASVAVTLFDAERLAQVNFSLPSFYAIEPGGFLDRASAIFVGGTVSPTMGIVPLPVTATGGASGPGGSTLTWRFGDGGSEPGTHVSHVYAVPGSYTVQPTVTDPFGDTGWVDLGVVVNSTVTVFGGPSPASGPPPLAVHFSVSAQEGAGPPYTYEWTLPNGTRLNGTQFNVTFTDFGRYSATVSVTDRAGHATNRTFWVTVEAPGVLTSPEILGVGVLTGGLLAAVVVLAGGGGRRPLSPSPRPAGPAGRRDA